MPRWPSEEERVWERTDIRGEDECWPWLGVIKKNGYGQLGGNRLAHRLAYRYAVGEIPEGLTLDHLCRNRSCVNPRHLEPVSMKENILRGNGSGARNARKTHCLRGHPLSGDNLIVQGTGRICRECSRRRKREYARTPEQRAKRTAYMRRWREKQRLESHYAGVT